MPWLSDANFVLEMADDSDVGDATEMPDETFSEELNSTGEVQNEILSQVSENVDIQSLQEDKPAQESSETEEVSVYKIFGYLIYFQVFCVSM